jgi:hypothetical protein
MRVLFVGFRAIFNARRTLTPTLSLSTGRGRKGRSGQRAISQQAISSTRRHMGILNHRAQRITANESYFTTLDAVPHLPPKTNSGSFFRGRGA